MIRPDPVHITKIFFLKKSLKSKVASYTQEQVTFFIPDEYIEFESPSLPPNQHVDMSLGC